MAGSDPLLTISELSRRSGVAASALRFYESLGLIRSDRTAGHQRRYVRSMLRRVAVVRVARQLGFSLEDVAEVLGRLPTDRPISDADWERLADGWRADLEARIDQLRLLRDDLSSCIGCGCLSLERCSLFNPSDRAASLGDGPRYLLGDSADMVLRDE